MSGHFPLEAPTVGPALPPRWLRYRDGFVVLQHLQALTCGSPHHGAHVLALARHLGFPPEQAERVVDYLVLQGYLSYVRPGIEVVLTREGLDYLAAGAGRRHSVRPRYAPSPGVPPLARERPGRAGPYGGEAAAPRTGMLRQAGRWLLSRCRALARPALRPRAA